MPSLHLCAGPIPALFCTGLDTGIVLDVGRSEAHVVAVYRGSNLTGSYAGGGEGLWDASQGCLSLALLALDVTLAFSAVTSR